MQKDKSSLPSGTSMSGHPLGFSMMRLCGVDPVAAVDRKAAWPEGYLPDYVENHRGTLRMRIALDRERRVTVVINGDEARISARGSNLPDSVLLGIKGHPVHAVVDHVLFTGSKLCVHEAVAFDPGEDGEGVHFVLDPGSAEFVAP